MTGSAQDFEQRRSIFLVGKEARKPEQGHAGRVEEEPHGVLQDVGHPRPPAVSPAMLEGRDDVRGAQRPLVDRHALDGIEPDRVREVGGVEVDRPARQLGRDAVGDFGGYVAVRIDEGEPRSGVNVGEHQVPQQRRLTRPGCTDEKDMTRAGFRREPELLAGSEGADLHMGNIRVHGPAAEPKRRCTGVALVAQCDVPILAWRHAAGVWSCMTPVVRIGRGRKPAAESDRRAHCTPPPSPALPRLSTRRQPRQVGRGEAGNPS